MNRIYELEFYSAILDALTKAKAGTVKRGDSVSWNSSIFSN